MDEELLHVLVASALTALATGLGALPLAAAHRPSRRWLGLAAGAAAGIMLAASFRLVTEGVRAGVLRTVAGMAAGAILIWFLQRFVRHGDEELFDDMRGGGRRALLVLGVMTMHSFAEGIGVGVAFGSGEEFGIFVAVAIAIHNVPEGLAISLVMVPRGMPVSKAALYSVLSSLPQPLVAVPAYLFVTAVRPFQPVGLGVASGAMLWMVIGDLLPGAREDAADTEIALVATLAAAAMVLVQVTLRV